MSTSPGVLNKALVAESLPQANQDNPGNDQSLRILKYGELPIHSAPPNMYGKISEGSAIHALNGTTGTGLTFVAAQTAFSDTAPNIYIENQEIAGGKSFLLNMIKMIATAAATSATAIHYAFILDTVKRAFSTDNTATLTAFNPNALLVLAMKIAIKVQNSATASAIAASSSSKQMVARGCLGGLTIAGDELQINFGQFDAGAQSATTAAEGAGQPGRRVSCSGGIMIPPGYSLTGHIWMPSSSASFNPEIELIGSAR